MGTRPCARPAEGGREGETKQKAGGDEGDPATLPNRYGVTFCLFTFDYTIWHTFTRVERGATRRDAAVRRARLGSRSRSAVLPPLVPLDSFVPNASFRTLRGAPALIFFYNKKWLPNIFRFDNNWNFL